MDYIYLDWNVIQYMKHSILQGLINGPEFSVLVKKLSKRYRFPFSAGHLEDLAISFRPENQENINSDLEYLNLLSQGYALEINEEEDKIRPVNNVNIHELFKKIATKTQEDIDIRVSGESYPVDMDSLPKDDLFRSHLEKNGGILNTEVMSNYIQELYCHKDDPDHYKKFRQQVSEMKRKFENRDTIINQNSVYFKGLIPFLDFISSEKPEDYLSDFESIIKSFCSIDGRYAKEMKMGHRIELTYNLLDFHPKFRDKVNRKNRPSNIGRDCTNLYFASQAKYYVTEDSSTLKKAAFVCKALSLRVKATSMNDFSAKFC